jgi:hypothetical protein
MHRGSPVFQTGIGPLAARTTRAWMMVLRKVFTKLGISSRKELAVALPDPGAAVAAT